MTVTAGILGFGPKMKCAALLSRLEADPAVADVLLFWSAAPTDALAQIEAGVPTRAKLRVRTSADNLGSAGGYAAILRWFAADGAASLLWLLDDDAILAPGCTSALLAGTHQPGFDPSRHLLMCYREDLPEFAAIVAAGQPVRPMRAGSCSGVHLWNIVRRPPAVEPAGGRTRTLASAPYGGLLIPRAALARLGLPNEKLFLYGDDVAWTLAFTRAGGEILLCSEAVIRDATPVWNSLGGDVSNMTRRVALLDDHKAYYLTRSGSYLSLTFYPGCRVLYWLNRLAFLGHALWLAVRHARLARFRLVWRALRDGERLARECPAGASMQDGDRRR